MELAVDQFLARALDPGEDLPAELIALEIGPGGGQLDHAEGFDEVGVETHLHAGDVEVLQGPGGLDPVVGVGRHGLVAEEIVFEARRNG